MSITNYLQVEYNIQLYMTHIAETRFTHKFMNYILNIGQDQGTLALYLNFKE